MGIAKKSAFVFLLNFLMVGIAKAAVVNVSFDGTITSQTYGYNQYVNTFSSIDWYTVNLSVPTSVSIDVTRTSGDLSPALTLFSYNPAQGSYILESDGASGMAAAAINIDLGIGQYALAVSSVQLPWSLTYYYGPLHDFSSNIYNFTELEDYTFYLNSNYHVNFAGDGITANVALVPLPASIWLLWSGVASFIVFARRKTTAQKH